MDSKAVLLRSDEYLNYGLKLSESEEILKEEINQWLPNKFIDFHTHLGLANHVTENVPESTLKTVGSTFLKAGASVHRKIQKVFFPEKEIYQVCFAFPFAGIRIRRVNQYLSDLAHRDSMFIPFCTGLSHARQSFMEDWYCYPYSGIKFYPATLEISNSILAAFPEFIWKMASLFQIPLMLHLPKPLRFSWKELVEILKCYPQAPVVLAHMGIEKLSDPSLRKAYGEIAKFPNVYLDTAMVTRFGVISIALDSLGPERIVHGSDQPLSLIRIKPIMHERLGLRYQTDYNYHWVVDREQAQYNKKLGLSNVISAALEIPFAIKLALIKTGLDNPASKQAIFLNNARKLLKIKN